MKLALVPMPSTRPDGALSDSHNLPRLFAFARLAEARGADDVGLSEHSVMAHRPGNYGPPALGAAPLRRAVARTAHHRRRVSRGRHSHLVRRGALATTGATVAQTGSGGCAFVGPEPTPLEMMAHGMAHIRAAMQVSMFAPSFDEVPGVIERRVWRVSVLGSAA